MIKDGLAGRIGRMAGDSGPERVLVAASFVNRVGNGLFNAAAALYFTLVVGLPAVQVGAALTIAGVIGLCAGIPGGHLADRRGARTIMMLALAVQAVSMAALVLVESWAALTIIATVDQIAAAAGGAAWGALVVRVGAIARPCSGPSCAPSSTWASSWERWVPGWRWPRTPAVPTSR
ncbi:MFS transporter [Streptomyces sp. NPDC006622]|uniref:MFS transporter n=1 Tax=Streptomyces sp. NPDC006622 TaxID=3155459 RepID=UPI0033BF50B5